MSNFSTLQQTGGVAMRINQFIGCAFLAFLLVSSSLGASILSAQEQAGLVGTVTDPSGAAVIHASVKLVNTRTGNTQEEQTNDTGYYRFVQLAPGPGYELMVTAAGFSGVTISNLYLAVASTRTQDVQLAIGAVTQTVEVKSEGSVSLDTTDSTIGNNFDLRAVSSLPNEFRGDVANLLRLQPGVVSADTRSNAFDDNGGSRDGAIAGGRADQDNITVDGIDASDFGIGQSFHTVSPIPVDAIQEFRTTVANPLAEEGRGSGGQTTITTKSGTNEWHGNAREYHRNTITEANDFFNNRAGVPRPALIRNQFGGNVGGPAKHDKLFFFFDYDGRRDASKQPAHRIVPLDHVRMGEIAYINNNAGCGPDSTIASTPNCISYATPALLTQLDPCSNPATAPGPCTVSGNPGDQAVTAGFNPGLLALFNARYPHSNDPTSGDGINTGGFFFNTPKPVSVNTYTARVDFNLTSRQKIFTRFNFYNFHGTQNGPSIRFPGDPITFPEVDQDRGWVIGHTWVLSPTLVNQFVYGESRGESSGIATLTGPASPGPNQGVYAGLNWLFNMGMSAPYSRPGGINSLNPVPTFRDDVSWQKGNHSLQFGGVFHPIRTRSELLNNFIFTNQGLVTNIPALDGSLRPKDILSDPGLDPGAVAATNWDNAFTSLVGLAGLEFNVFNYTHNGATVPAGQGSRRDYRYYETEVYAQDTWKVRRNFTVTLGLRYAYDSVPYETNGYEATVDVPLSTMLATRAHNAAAGIADFNSTPILTYNLSGKNNPGGRSLYASNPYNFSPRVGFAWNPGFREGLLGSVFGDHKTVLRGSAGLIYDHTALSAVNFIEDQSSYIFSGNSVFQASTSTPEQMFAQSPRFTTVDAANVDLSIPPFQTSIAPFTGDQCPPGFPVCGTLFGQFGNYTIDRHFKTPYSLTFSMGVQRELPSGFQLEVDYVARLGRRLATLADSGQIFNFVDPASHQSLAQAVTNLEIDARAGIPFTQVQPQPFFENQMPLAAGPNCADAVFPNPFPYANCTQFVYTGSAQPPTDPVAQQNVNLLQGNLNGIIRSLVQAANLPPNVGFTPQFVSNYYLANKSYSNYNAMYVVLRKKLSYNLQMDFNYTFSHSIDNFSGIANNNGNPFNNAQSVLCDTLNLATCKGNSEFDMTHQISGDVIYDLPFGRGKAFGHNASTGLDEVIGGWQVSGGYTWHTGFAFPILDNASTTTFGNTAYPIFNGNTQVLGVDPHTDANGVQLFKNPQAVLQAFSAPTGLETGSRDELRGPHFANFDLALSKTFPVWKERYRLQFRAEAYNAFNHPNFALPANTNINQPNFGLITATSSVSGDQAARVMQFGLRFDF
jgi:hypothetical protein